MSYVWTVLNVSVLPASPSGIVVEIGKSRNVSGGSLPPLQITSLTSSLTVPVSVFTGVASLRVFFVTVQPGR